MDDHTNAVELLHPKLKQVAMSVVEKLRQEGEQMGLEKGKLEGKLEGDKEKSFAIARVMMQENEPIEKIIRFTGLSQSDIEQLGIANF